MTHTHSQSGLARTFALLALCVMIAFPAAIKAQTAGEGSITGIVADSTGAAIPDATVTATNVSTNVATTRTTTGSGTYQIAPLLPGLYSVTVTAKGFKTLKQDNLDVVALGVLGFNPVMSLGEATETVIVTTAPPMLDTESATVGMVMENTTYANLPLQMTTATQRDPTAFAALAPGAQAGIRLPIIGGANNYLGQLYLDGMPAETINQQGDNRPVALAMSVDAVDQFQVVTSTPPAEYQGAGAANFTMKSGGNKYHGQVSDFIRNTAFDSWSFTNKWLTKPGLNPATGALYVCSPIATTATVGANTVTVAPRGGCQTKPAEHTNEMSLSFGGKVPHTAGKLFFFIAYDKFHSRYQVAPAQYTIPTTLERTGDFTELNGGIGTGGLTGICAPGVSPTCVGGDPSAGGTNPALIFDPNTVNPCNLAGTICTRAPFQGLKNGIPTNNVIPSSYISSISQTLQSFMPAPTNPSVLVNNYAGSLPKGFDNHATDWRLDYDVSARQRISTIGAIGKQIYLQNYSTNLPLPYTAGTTAVIFPRIFDVEDDYTINSRLTNQLKYGFTRFPQPQINATDGMSKYFPSAMGITGTLAPGGDATEFPAPSFVSTGSTGLSPGGSGTPMSAWGSSGGGNSTQTVTPSTYSLVDNVLWVKGKHSFTFGFTYLWEQANSSAPVGYSGVISLPYGSNSTANYAFNTKTNQYTNGLDSKSGLSYASFLLGAVSQTSIGLQPVSELGGRYREASPYAEDSWKIRPNLTLDLGIRWDYYSPYHEVKDRWTFLNPNLTNPLTNSPGLMQFAGNYGGTGVSCGCRTPVQTYWKNFGPRLGFAWQANDKTVFRGGIATVFSAAGGVGGRGGNFNGTGQLGFNVNWTSAPDQTSGPNAGPSYYLSNAALLPANLRNTAINNGLALPANPTPGVAAQELNTGQYINSGGALVTSAGTVSLADSYISGRAPEFTFFNFGIERVITKDMTFAANYAGDESHFLNTGGNVRGYWANQLDPAYLVTLGGLTGTGGGALLTSPASPPNVAIAKAALPSLNIPAFYINAGMTAPTSSTLTIAQGLVAFPQYCGGNPCGTAGGVTDLWGANVGNFSYHSLQLTLMQRTAHGLSFNVNYTYSKNIGDDGNFRSGFAIPAAAISGGGQSWKQDRIERSWTAASAPSVLHAFGVWQLPFGKGHMGGDNFLVRAFAGGWQFSSIYTYSAGSPVAVTSSHCSATTNSPLQGTCMPDLAPGATNARINGSYGTGPNGTTACNLGIGPGCKAIQYIDPSKFQLPAKNGSVYLIGNAPRTAPLTLRNPGTENLDASLRRSFPLFRDWGTFVFEADCLNVWNKVTMGTPGAGWNNTGSSTSPVYPAAFGTITGTSGNPRDWQFAGHINF